MPTSFARKSTCHGPSRRLHVALSFPDAPCPAALRAGAPRRATPSPARRAEGLRPDVRDTATSAFGRLVRIARAAPGLGIGTLTVRIPDACAGTLGDALDAHAAELRRLGVRTTVIGPRARFPRDLALAAATVERATSAGRFVHLRLGVLVSSRAAIVAAFQGWDERPPRTAAEVSDILGADGPPGTGVPDVDVLVCGGGAVRLNDFALWECAGAEIRAVAADVRTIRASDLADALAGVASSSRAPGPAHVRSARSHPLGQSARSDRRARRARSAP